MPIVTGVKPQKNKKRVNIYLDDKFGFGLDLENFIKLHLKVEQELTQKEVEDIVKKAEFQKTLDYLLKFAMMRPRSEKEISDWFKRKKVHESMQKDLFDRLKHFELLNDLKFAQWWVDQRMQYRSKSKRMLNNELRVKGIKDEIIKKVLSETKIDEPKMIAQILEKKAYKWRNLTGRDQKQKMTEYLLRNGYDWDNIKTAIDEFLSKR